MVTRSILRRGFAVLKSGEKGFFYNLNDFDGKTGSNNSTRDEDILVGTSVKDTISGREGNDEIYGLAGNDTISGDDGNDTIYGGSGDDKIDGNNGTDTLYGGSGNDNINGNNDNDRIIGGYGADTLTGNGGGDTFVFLDICDTGDLIKDFSIREGDKLDFSAIAGITGSSAALSNTVTANSVNYFQSGLDTIVWADTDANTSTVELQVTLSGVTASLLLPANFIL